MPRGRPPARAIKKSWKETARPSARMRALRAMTLKSRSTVFSRPPPSPPPGPSRLLPGHQAPDAEAGFHPGHEADDTEPDGQVHRHRAGDGLEAVKSVRLDVVSRPRRFQYPDGHRDGRVFEHRQKLGGQGRD